MWPLSLVFLTVLTSALAQGSLPAAAAAQHAAAGAETSGPLSSVVAPVAPQTVYLDPLEYERSIRLQLRSVTHEQQRLTAAGRPSYYTRRRVGGFVGLGVGGAAVLTTLGVVIAVLGPPLPHSGEGGEFNSAHRVALPISFVVGSAIAAVGIWALSNANRDHLYRDELARLSGIRDALQLAFKQARRQRKLAARR